MTGLSLDGIRIVEGRPGDDPRRLAHLIWDETGDAGAAKPAICADRRHRTCIDLATTGKQSRTLCIDGSRLRICLVTKPEQCAVAVSQVDADSAQMAAPLRWRRLLLGRTASAASGTARQAGRRARRGGPPACRCPGTWQPGCALVVVPNTKVRAKEAGAVRRRKPVKPWAQSLAATCMSNSGRVAPRNRLRRLRLLRVASLRSASTAPRPALGLPGRSARCARSTCSRRRAWPRFASLAVARQDECLALPTCIRVCCHAAGRRRSFIPPVSAEPCGPADREEGPASRLSGRLSSQCRA